MVKKRNWHKDAIDILAWPEMNATLMLRQIAKESPAVLVKAAYATGYTPAVTLESRVKELMKAGQKIDAIKMVRNERQMTLVDAKNYVESLA
jgi:ribosomal protein L7/L12